MKTVISKFKRFPVLIWFLNIVIILICSCQKVDEPKLDTSEELLSYDESVNMLAQAISRLMVSTPDFKLIVKHEALKQLDGDYDILLSHIADKRLSEYNTVLKKSAKDILIKDLIAEHSTSKSLLKATGSVIDNILNNNPDLQISVPLHCEEWDLSSHTPNVAFLESTYDDGVTEYVQAYTPDGSKILISAVEEPTEAVVVIGLNERDAAALYYPIVEKAPETPEDLGGIITESGIRLTWKMPTISNSSNTSGYYVYRKGSSGSSYVKIGTSVGCYNRSYNDNSVEPSKSYSYYVVSYFGTLVSGNSDLISISAPATPKPVASFDAIQCSNKSIELRWDNEYSQSFSSTELYRYRQGIDSDYKLLKTFSPSAHYYFDNDLVEGKKFTYKIHHRSNLGLSNAKYDFSQVPYRDISRPSPVYIQALRFKDWKIEGWLAGKPEFYVSVGNVNLTTGKTYMIQEKIFLEFRSRTSNFKFPDIKIFDWSPGIWYDMLTFSVVEHDAGGKMVIKFSAGFNSKTIEKMNMMPVSFGVEGEYEVGNGSENCGCSYMNYYDIADAWLKFPGYGVELLISEKKHSEILLTDLLK